MPHEKPEIAKTRLILWKNFKMILARDLFLKLVYLTLYSLESCQKKFGNESIYVLLFIAANLHYKPLVFALFQDIVQSWRRAITQYIYY